MELSDLVRALLTGDLLTARQWVADAKRASFDWEHVARPSDLDSLGMAVAAAMTELLARRSGATPPKWTREIGRQDAPVFLDPGIEEMPRTMARLRTEAPEVLRDRNLFATADFLDFR